jgi:hypothetical protein
VIDGVVRTSTKALVVLEVITYVRLPARDQNGCPAYRNGSAPGVGKGSTNA